MKKNTVQSCVDDLKMLRALPPYNYAGNIVAHDGYFAKSIDSNYSPRVKALAERQILKDIEEFNKGFTYVDILSNGCEGWLNLFFDDEIVAMVDSKHLADRIRAKTKKRIRG